VGGTQFSFGFPNQVIFGHPPTLHEEKKGHLNLCSSQFKALQHESRSRELLRCCEGALRKNKQKKGELNLEAFCKT
jgi:hypothetical protein